MAYHDVVVIPAHHNIYTNSNQREVSIYYSIPSNGTNEETCMIVLVPGFSATSQSNVYKKMRDVFADQYNAVVVQCDYFGHEFMQDGLLLDGEFEYEQLKNQLSEKTYEKLINQQISIIELLDCESITLTMDVSLGETVEHFADLGFLQAIDIITAIEAMKLILRQNNFIFNDKKIIGYGQSQGAYLLYVVNRLAPHLLTYIIDNCGWEKPLYLWETRNTVHSLGEATIIKRFTYLVNRNLIDKESMILQNLYKDFESNAFIYSFVASNDKLVNNKAKIAFIENQAYQTLHVVRREDVDEYKFFSSNHSLNANLLRMFDYVWAQIPKHINKATLQQNFEVVSSTTILAANYTGALPVFNLIK